MRQRLNISYGPQRLDSEQDSHEVVQHLRGEDRPHVEMMAEDRGDNAVDHQTVHAVGCEYVDR